VNRVHQMLICPVPSSFTDTHCIHPVKYHGTSGSYPPVVARGVWTSWVLFIKTIAAIETVPIPFCDKVNIVINDLYIPNYSEYDPLINKCEGISYEDIQS